ncbi:MAG: hypothetical protein ACI8XC_000204 [Gammaproteobacteria bacterium]|jgi:hypothetical protein
MIGWFSKQKREEKKKQADEASLKKALAEKVFHYEEQVTKDVDDHTEIFVGGKKLRVPKEHITILDIKSN